MSRKEHRPTPGTILAGLAWPFVLGLIATCGFYYLVYQGPLTHPLMRRYFAGHPINLVETALFFVALAALGQKLASLLAQQSSISAELLPDKSFGQPVSKASEWLDALANLNSGLRHSYLGKRLTAALETVERKASADTLEEDLKHLSDLDANRAHESYGLVRIIIWAIPMLGFLGTVVGITAALGQLDAKELTNSLETAIKGLTDGLYVAFDSTAIALCFAMLLMFIQFMLDRIESQLLTNVDDRVAHELAGRFEVIGSVSDPQIAAVQRMGQAVLKSTEVLVGKQVELWQRSLNAAHDEWARNSRQSTEQMQTALGTALSQSLAQHAAHLTKSEQASSEQASQRWEQWQTALSHNARLLHAQQQEMVKQGEMMTQAIRAAGEVIQLERALNDNLSALAGAKNFEDTVMSLAAAIHLLNARLARQPETSHVELKSTSAKGRAA
ncbi:MAG: MotA/TolQ/ExbB proton channel family protein [Pirellulaceae bacterium]